MHERAHFSRSIGKYWDKFYHHHTTHFFKDRQYIDRDYPHLAVAASEPVTMLELGCGVGNAFFPLVAQLSHLYVTAFDLSRKAMGLIAEHPLYKTGRICAFDHNAVAGTGTTAAAARQAHASFLATVANLPQNHSLSGSSSGSKRQLNAVTAVYNELLPLTSFAAAADVRAYGNNQQPPFFRGFDTALMLFMASALPHEQLGLALSEAFSCLRPGGVLMFRDYAVYDEAELRFGKGRRLGEHLFVRSDGTIAAFFSVEQMGLEAQRAGFEVVDFRYLYRKYTNRALQQTLRRIWLHAVFRKPGCDPVLGPVAASAGVAPGPLANTPVTGGESGLSHCTTATTVDMSPIVALSEYEWLRDVCGFVGGGYS